MARDNIRNFCIIAHIDHGKSTLSDRILELTKSVDERTMEDQIFPDVTPHFNRLSKEGIFFTNCYANSFRTDRGTGIGKSTYRS